MISRVTLLFCLAGCLLGAALLTRSEGSSNRHSDADIALLASDAHVVIGDVPLIVPFTALPGFVEQRPTFSLNKSRDRQAGKERLEAFRQAASDVNTAPAMDNLEIRIRTYGWDDADASMLRVCSRLTRQWSRSICDDPWHPLQQTLPNGSSTFYLADDRKPDLFKGYSTVGREDMSDQLRQMRLVKGAASVVCDKQPNSSNKRFCTAAANIEGHLIAVWSVWDSVGETADQQAEREGAAIRAFVLNGLGATENFPALLSAVCGLTQPNAPEGVRPNPCS